jgi:hypothetical protein
MSSKNRAVYALAPPTFSCESGPQYHVLAGRNQRVVKFISQRCRSGVVPSFFATRYRVSCDSEVVIHSNSRRSGPTRYATRTARSLSSTRVPGGWPKMATGLRRISVFRPCRTPSCSSADQTGVCAIAQVPGPSTSGRYSTDESVVSIPVARHRHPILPWALYPSEIRCRRRRSAPAHLSMCWAASAIDGSVAARSC